MSQNNKFFQTIQRQYTSEQFDPEEWNSVQFELMELLKRKINSTTDLETIIMTHSEIGQIISTVLIKKHVARNLNVDDKAKSDDFTQFYTNIYLPALDFDFQIKQRILESPYSSQLPDNFHHFLDIIRNEMKVISPKNRELLQKEQVLVSQYEKIVAQGRVQYRGKEYRFAEMKAFLGEADIEIRREAYLAVQEGWWSIHTQLDNLYSELIQLRVKIAKNAGFENYRDYAHYSRGRMAYSPQDVLKYHITIEQTIVPMARKLFEQKTTLNKEKQAKPWDIRYSDLDPSFFSCQTPEELISATNKIYSKVHPEFGILIQNMFDKGYMDLLPRQGKANELGFCVNLPADHAAFLFMNMGGDFNDFTIFCHEGGHALNHLYASFLKIGSYQKPRSEIGELCSMGMEKLCYANLDTIFYDPKIRAKAQRYGFITQILKLPWFTIMDIFQHWVYSNPTHSVEERHEYYANLVDRFQQGIDWSECEKTKGIGWMQDSLPFWMPFYFIEYVMAEIGSLAILRNYRSNPSQTISAFKKMMGEHFSKPLPQVYQTAGIEFNLSPEYVQGVLDFLQKELDLLNEQV